MMQVVYDTVIFTKQVSGVSDILFMILFYVCATFPFTGLFKGQSFCSIKLMNLQMPLNEVLVSQPVTIHTDFTVSFR